MSERQKGAILPIVLVGLVALVIITAGVFIVRKPTSPFDINSLNPTESTESPTEPNLPPLYPGVEWEEPVKGTIRFRDKDNNFDKQEGYGIDSKKLNSYPTAFLEYYKDELTKTGWQEAWSAGGPVGESYGYQKGERYFQFGIQIPAIDVYLVFIEYN